MSTVDHDEPEPPRYNPYWLGVLDSVIVGEIVVVIFLLCQRMLV